MYCTCGNTSREQTMKIKEKSLQVLESELDIVFSRFIAYRDHNSGWRCFICGNKIYSKGDGETGHYIRRQHMPTRYNEMNCNFICFDCNRDDPQHEKRYKHALIRKYGGKEVEQLEAKKNTLQKFMRFELQEMIDHYGMEVIKLKRLKGL